MTDKDDYMNNVDKEQQEEQKEKILVPVRCRKRTHEEELSAENNRQRPFETPRRWHIH